MQQPKHDADSHALIIVVPVIVALFFTSLWQFFSSQCYVFAAQFCYYMLTPFSMVGVVEHYREGILNTVLQAPNLKQCIEWLNMGFAWPSALGAILCGVLAAQGVRHPIATLFKGALSPDALMRHQATVFSAIAPLIPVARQLHLNQDPRWHEAYHPHEFIRHFGLADAQQTLNIEATHRELLKQLGRRISYYGKDPASSVFVDRLNPYEKTVFALLAPLALKRKDGTAEYQHLRDALNYSVDPKTQTPNLTLAQASFSTYRADKRVQSLALRHPYSVTFLMELFTLAKQSGRVTTVEFLGWLRPNQTLLYFALNTVGRRTPFTESCGAYAQWQFEKRCVLDNRIPVKPCIDNAVQALLQEWQHYCSATDEDDETSLWGELSNNAHITKFS